MRAFGEKVSQLPRVLAVIVFGLLASRAEAALTLEIPPLSLPNTSVLNFAAIPNEKPPLPEELKAAVSADTENRTYRVRVPVRTIFWSDACLCFGYTVVVERTDSPGAQVFDVRATPRGIFNEQVVDVPFRIKEGTRVESGVIPLPVASYHSESDAIVLDGSATRSIRLSGNQFVEVQVKNTSGRFAVTAMLAPGHSAVEPAPDDLFQGTPAIEASNGTQVTIKPGEASRIRIAVTPKTINAIQRSIPPIGPDGSHTNMALKFDYQVGPFAGDRVSFFSRQIDVRFAPSFFSLILSLIGGALLGVTLRSVSSRSWHVVNFARALTASFVAALVIDVVAMLMASGGSKLILFNYGIDPSQLLPTAAIGIFCGLNGYRSVRWVMQFFKPEEADSGPEPVGA